MEKSQTERSKTLIIASMHRSGSSLTAALLQSAGLHIGRRLMGAAEANIKGHFENLDFWSFHQKVLKSQGANEEGWTLQDQIQVDDYYREEAQNLVSQNAISGLWGWKDPRTTLFLDFWANLLPEANFLLLFRYPWEVVSSLYRKGQPYTIFQEQPELAIKFWLHYNQKILNFCNSFPQGCFLVSLNNFLQNTPPCIDALNQKFRINLAVPNSTIYQPSLLHREDSEGHRASLISHYYPEAIALYQELEARAWQLTDAPNTSWQEKLKSSPYRVWAFQDWAKVSNLQGENQKLQKELGQTQSQLHQTQEELGQTQSQLHQTEELLKQSQAQRHETEVVLEQSMTQLQQKTHELQQSESQVSQLQEALGRSHSQLDQKAQELEQTQAQLHETENLLEQSQAQLPETEAVLEQSMTHLSQIKEQEGVQVQSQYLLSSGEAERLLYQEFILSQIAQPKDMHYHLLVWDAWYAYINGNMTQMRNYLQQSWKFTPFLKTETILNWLENFARLSNERGVQFDSDLLTQSREWQELVGRRLIFRSAVAYSLPKSSNV